MGTPADGAGPPCTAHSQLLPQLAHAPCLAAWLPCQGLHLTGTTPTCRDATTTCSSGSRSTMWRRVGPDTTSLCSPATAWAWAPPRQDFSSLSRIREPRMLLLLDMLWWASHCSAALARTCLGCSRVPHSSRSMFSHTRSTHVIPSAAHTLHTCLQAGPPPGPAGLVNRHRRQPAHHPGRLPASCKHRRRT